VDFTLKSRRVMVVDNDLAIHSLMRRILSHWGCEQVEISSDGSSAVESYRCVHPDLVIMDVEMPEMDGHAAAEAIKRLDEAAAILLSSIAGAGRAGIHALRASVPLQQNQSWMEHCPACNCCARAGHETTLLFWPCSKKV